jgi:iron complex transport system substrate-binding protein
VTDFDGNTVSLPQPATRIVALAPHIVENLFSIGAGDVLIGVIEYSDFPAQAKQIPRIGSYQKINIEAVVDLEPDLILGWDTGNSHTSMNRLKELGFPLYLDRPDSLEDVARSLRDLGVLVGHTEQADLAASDYLSQLARLREQNRNKPKVTSFYQVWNSPLQTISGDHIINDAIEICGGENIYRDEVAVAPVINIESVLERNPQAIIASGVGANYPQWLDDWKQWPTLAAVRYNNLIFVNGDHIQRHTERLLQGINSLCEQLDAARERLAQPPK